MLTSDRYEFWQEQYTQERARLLAALGDLTAGGVLEQVQHIGATSVPGMLAAPCIDVGLSVWPFPLLAPQQRALQQLGYELITDAGTTTEQRFRHASDAFQLFAAESGDDRWTNYLVLRDYWRTVESARQLFSTQKERQAADSTAYSQWKAQVLPQMVQAAHAWWISRQSFEPVEVVAAELKDYACFWAVSSGWAVDLYLGRVTRVHRDVDVAVSRSEQLALHQHLTNRGWKLLTPFESKLEPWPAHMLLELPRHQVLALRDGTFMDCLLSDLTNGLWHYRRDPAVVRQLDRAVLSTAQGIPFLAPELVLLFKSKNTSNQKERSQDQFDFEAAFAHLEPERRAWLRWALLATNPEHPWIEQLT
ncbi:hypothetical protein TFLX_05818 [Thermoflexales bacterium]|nr:hypothetical protein TFLX_05818 [Thermoflexales bacterium]